MTNLFNGIYKGTKVLVTGHTGFKGSWLCFWLEKMGAEVIGYSLEPPTHPSHYTLLNIDMLSVIGDVKSLDGLNEVFRMHNPDIVFHLAAQALVRPSYTDPINTYETNVMGTLNVLEACRNNGVKAIVNITSDKVYHNQEMLWGYRENDLIGGYDPYSSSKGCADILAASYRNSYFNVREYKKSHNTLLASCRAGNVIGGGDWAKDRLMTDIMIAISEDKKVEIRNPEATRPWQHVLEPLSGYLQVGQKLLEEKINFSDDWNFGPSAEEDISVKSLVINTKRYWSKLEYVVNKDLKQPHEAKFLKLDCSKAHVLLEWKSVWANEIALEKTVKWYQSFYENNTELLTRRDLESYISDAQDKGLSWTKN